MILPVAVTLILLGRYIMEAGLSRHEVAVYIRSSTVNAAATNSTNPIRCRSDRDPFSERETVSQTASVSCSQRDGERGLRQEQSLFRAMRQGASAWPQIMRDVDRRRPINDIYGSGQGSMVFQRPAFLSRQSGSSTSHAALWPKDELFEGRDAPWRAAHDPVIWQELSRRRTRELFPELFPSR